MLTAEVKSKSYEVRRTIDTTAKNVAFKKVAAETPDGGTSPGPTK
jgi:hypothetical protein